MTGNVICFISGVLLGMLFTYLHAQDRESEFRAEIKRLEGQDKKLRKQLEDAECE